MKLITAEYVDSLRPCAEYTLERLRATYGAGLTPRERAYRVDDVPLRHRCWTLRRVLRDWCGIDALREYIGWCALRARYHAADARTAAARAAADRTDAADWAAADWAAADAAAAVAAYAAASADRAAAEVAAETADKAVETAIWAAASAARAAAVDVDDERRMQLDYLVEMIEAEDK